jgi:type II secretory pathway component GspD/PulD (secretin)
VTAVLFAAVASGQQVIHLMHVEQSLQEMANAIKATGDVQDVSIDPVKKTVTVNGTAEQIALAQWLCGELDKPSAVQSFARSQYPASTSTQLVVQVFYLAHSQSYQALQESVIVARSIAGIQRSFPYNPISAVVASGTADQLAVFEWLLTELDAPAAQIQAPVLHDRAVPVDPRGGNRVQVFFLPRAHSPREVQDMLNMTRALVDIMWLFPATSRNALVLRGTAEQVAFADWVLTLLNDPTAPAADATALEYSVQGDTRYGNLARIFFLSHPQGGQELVNTIRSTTKMRVLYSSLRNALAVRGTGDQIAQAEQLIRERDQE